VYEINVKMGKAIANFWWKREKSRSNHGVQ